MKAVGSFSRSHSVASALRSLRVFLATTIFNVREWLAGLRSSHSTIGPRHRSALPRGSSILGRPCGRADCAGVNRKCAGPIHSGRPLDSRSGNSCRGRASMVRLDWRRRSVCRNYFGNIWRHVGHDRPRRLVNRCSTFRKKVYRRLNKSL